MKRVTIIGSLTCAVVLSACGSGDQNVSRNQVEPFELTAKQKAELDSASSRSALDLLSFD